MINNYILFDSYIISDKRLVFNFDKFENNKRPLLIFGIGGNGKSTLGKKLAKKYNVKLIEGDSIFEKYLPVNSKKLQNMDDDEYLDKLNKMYDELESYIRDNHRVIIEGVQLYMLYNDYKEANLDAKFILNSPMIILGLSALRSAYRIFKREGILTLTPFETVKKEYKKFRKDAIAFNS